MRQVLTYPDLPPVLTQAAGDARYSLVAHNHDAVYATVAHLHTGVYLPVSHEPGVDPHTQYLNNARGDLRYQPVGSYLTTAAAASTYLPLTGGALSGTLSIGTTPASSGTLRLPNNATIEWRNVGNTNNCFLGLNNSDTFRYGINGVNRMTITPTGSLTLSPDAGVNSLVAQGNVIVGSGVIPAAWGPSPKVIQFGATGSVYDVNGNTQLSNNVYEDAGGNRAMTTGPGSKFVLVGGQLYYYSLASATAGATMAYTLRLQINASGALSLTPDPATNALSIGAPVGATFGPGHNNSLTIGGTTCEFAMTNVGPYYDNYIGLGQATYRWVNVYAVNGTIQTSTYDAKEAFAPLDPAACAAAVLETDWVNFAYKPSAYQEQPGQDEEARTKGRAGHAKVLADTQHTRHQKGYVLQSPVHKTHDLFGLSDRQSASPSSDLAVVACALQHCLLEIAELKARLA